MKGKVKSIAIFLVLIMIFNIFAPTMKVFAATTKTINITSTGITTRVVLSTDPDDDGQAIENCEFFVDEQNPCNQNATSDRLDGDVYVYIEPDFFAGGRIGSIKINGESKEVSVPTGRNVYKLPSTSTYTIEVQGVAEEHYNIMWANSGADIANSDYDDEEVLLKNGSAKIIKVYDNEEDMNEITDEIEHVEDGCVSPEGRGFVQLAEGNVVIFEFVPEYGYQLTSVSANGTKLKPQETINQYKYVMPATNIHFQATFTKTEDIVKSATSKVTSGSVTIGKDEIKSGTTVLSVKDATLTDTQKNSFKEKAGEYEVSNILDIKLDQVFYKGSTDLNDVWTNSLGSSSNLKTPATITLKLDKGVDGDTVVLVHEKHDGTYEVIDTTYDETNHTISFKTSSFSNYAIASKKTENNTNTQPDNNVNEPEKQEPESNIANPQTGDNIVIIAYIFGMAVIGLGITKKVNKTKTSKH